MSFVVSVSVVAAVYVAMFFIERAPRLRFRALPFRRPYLTTDVAWGMLTFTLIHVTIASSVIYAAWRATRVETRPGKGTRLS